MTDGNRTILAIGIGVVIMTAGIFVLAKSITDSAEHQKQSEETQFMLGAVMCSKAIEKRGGQMPKDGAEAERWAKEEKYVWLYDNGMLTPK